MGFATILESKEIILLATGESKQDIFYKLQKLNTPDPDLPASYLLNHPKTTIFTDIKI